MTGRVLRQRRIDRAHLHAHPERVYAFGDNMVRHGRGGQAREMRGEPNAIGVPTKWRPDNDEDAFFDDRTFDEFPIVKAAIDVAFMRLWEAMANGRDVVIPADGLGTGLADLANRAPTVLTYIEAKIAALEKAAEAR